MNRRWFPTLLVGLLGLAGLTLVAESAHAQGYDAKTYFHYPYYYFPHNSWPANSPKWPEAPGQPYQRPPTYMAYPPFKEAHWRYEWLQPQSYYRGSHFWLDVF